MINSRVADQAAAALPASHVNLRLRFQAYARPRRYAEALFATNGRPAALRRLNGAGVARARSPASGDPRRSLRQRVDRLAARVLDLGRPPPAHRLDDLCRHRDVIELLGHAAALGVGPVEEFQRGAGGGRIRRLLWDEDEAGAGDRPGLGAGFIGEDDAEARRCAPIRIA